ncbi:MAG: geranylgeranylglycerol-phosphate geranylgeranyltransferase [Flavobacteriales bacterium]|nr:geranylgeranylglycerol-phosphate geranylgeranyltransferase [Flavobacteriales bacterium]
MTALPLSSKRSNLRGLIVLARPLNLTIAALTLLLIRYGWMTRWVTGGPHLQTSVIQVFEATLVMVLLMAAGNIINAYFDVQEDRINRPQRALVDRTVKRRVLIVTHQVLNLIGLLIAAHLSWSVGSVGPLILAIMVSWILWRYSASWKAKPLVGNLSIAFLLGMVPLWLASLEASGAGPELQRDLLQNLGAYGAMAMAIGMVRELAKDAMDMEGDAAAKKSTFPLWKGENLTRRLCLVLWICVALMYAAGIQHWGGIEEWPSWIQWATPFPGWAACLFLLLQRKTRWKTLSRATLATLILGIVQCAWIPGI